MLDIIGAVSLTLIAVLLLGTLIRAGTKAATARWQVAFAGGVWFVVIAGVAAAGIFSASGPLGIAAIGAAVSTPVAAGPRWIAHARGMAVTATRMSPHPAVRARLSSCRSTPSHTLPSSPGSRRG